LDIKLRNKLVKLYIWKTALSGAVNWILRKVDQKYLESVEMWCGRRTEKIIWTDRVRNKAELHGVREERNILHTVQRRKANWIGHVFCRKCPLKHVIEGKIGERQK
jgi:hypothetical protein